MNKLKIGFVIDDSMDKSRFDGVQQYVRTLGAWMASKDHQVRYLAGESKDAGEFDEYVYSMTKNISVSGNQNRLTIPLPASGKNINEVLDKENFDVLHVQMPYNPLLSGKVISRMKSKTALVGTFHIYASTHFEKLGAKALSFSQKRSLNRFDKFLAVSEAAKSFAKETYSIESQISPNVVNIQPYKQAKPKEFLKGDNGTIIFIGRLVERKGCQHLIRALDVLHRSGELEGVKVHICSDGPMRIELEQMVSDSNLYDQVFFHGFIPEEEKADYLASADVAVFPATGGESFGIVLIEAMASGKSVVLGGNNEGYSTVLKDQPQLLFDPKNIDDFAKIIDKSLKNDSFKKQMLNWQTKHVQNYNVEKVGQNVINFYREAIRART